jgi:hypothetical protein
LMIWAPGVDHPANPAEPNTSGSGMLAPPPNMPMPKAAFSQGQSMVPEDEEGSGSYADPNGFVRHGKKKQPHNTVPADSDSTTVINSNVEEDVN